MVKQLCQIALLSLIYFSIGSYANECNNDNCVNLKRCLSHRKSPLVKKEWLKLIAKCDIFGKINYLPDNIYGKELTFVTTKINNGENTHFLEFPWMALLIYTDERKQPPYYCSGFLISERYVLTAAHCVSETRVGQLVSVRLGEYDYNIKHYNLPNLRPIDVGIEEIIAHEYVNKVLNDIALIRLNATVKFTDLIKPICIPRENLDLTTNAETYFMAGWGKTEYSELRSQKRKVCVPARKMEDCDKFYGPYNGIDFNSTKMFCLAGRNRQDACEGDSGGPVMIFYRNRWFAVGIVSHGARGCGDNNLPSLSTKVSYYSTWIVSQMRP